MIEIIGVEDVKETKENKEEKRIWEEEIHIAWIILY